MMNQPPRKLQKTDTQSLARLLFDESLTNIDQIRDVRNAAYKSGFAMAAAIVNNYVRSVERSGGMVSAVKLKEWVKETKHWRNVSSLDDAPNIV